MIAHITLNNFKKVKKFDSDLDKISILVGANNSGKSSVLQGIQFTIMAEVARRYFNRDTTVPQEKLFYSPSSDFTVLRHNNPYTNYSGNTSELVLKDDSVPAETFSITLKREGITAIFLSLQVLTISLDKRLLHLIIYIRHIHRDYREFVCVKK